MGYKIYFRDGHTEWIDNFVIDNGIIVFYTSGQRKIRYNGVFEEEKTRVTWDENGVPYFEDYWVPLGIITIKLEKAE